MVFKNKSFNKFWRFSSSFQLGIPILIAIAILIAAGTIVESNFDSMAAKKLIYDSWVMWTVMCLLIYNLVIVVVDRWPWQPRHYPFIFVHAGIITLIAGGYITSKFGLDGQLVVPIGSKNGQVSVDKTDLVVYATFNGDSYSKIVEREVDFFLNPPTEEKPFLVELGVDQVQILEYVKYARLSNKVRASKEPGSGASIRFQIKNANVQQVEQITQTKKNRIATFNLGPAKIHLGEVPQNFQPQNEIFLTPLDNDQVTYTIFHKDSLKPFKIGKLKIGEVVSTGWMGLELRLLDYLPLAEEEYDVVRKERPSPLTTPAIRIRHRHKERWVALNDIVKLFGDSSAFLFSYQNRRLNLGFDLHLKKFDVQHYQGTTRAMEYSSLVEAVSADQNTQSTISMNEPLKFRGYTIYQASFQEDESGQPTASVFSVNKDPGRWVKYIGSIIMSFGIIWLFYQRRKKIVAV